MSYLKFSREVSNILENKKSARLSLLIEKDDLGDMFGDENMDAEETEGGSEGGGETEGGSEGGGETEGGSEGGEEVGEEVGEESGTEGGDEIEGGGEGVTKEQIEEDLGKVADNLENVMSFYDRFGQRGSEGGAFGLHAIQDFISSHVSNSIEESKKNKSKKSYRLNSKNSISYFLNEKVSVDDVEKDIDAVNNIIDKGSELIDKFKKGTDLNINRYVDAAINAFKNFDSLFSKESIVKQAVINLIVLNSGAKAEKNIKEFEELFHEELHKQFGIEYEEHALITKKQNVATGAVKQG